MIILPGTPDIRVGGALARASPRDNWLQVRENTSLELECSALGGVPRPSLTWWMDSRLLDTEDLKV